MGKKDLNRELTEERSKHKKRYLPSMVTKEMQLSPNEVLFHIIKLKKWTVLNIGQEMRQLELSCTVGRVQTTTVTLKTLCSLKLNRSLPCLPVICFWVYNQRNSINLFIKSLVLSFLSGTISKSPN